jgi:hypothetical protein
MIGTVASNQLTQEYTRILSQSNVALSGVRPTYVNQLKQDTLVRSLKQDGSWNLIDVLYIFANDESTGNFALLNWTNPSLYSLTKINSPVFFANRGYSSVSSTNYLSSSWAPSNGVNFQQNSASIGGMVYNTPTSNSSSALLGANGASQNAVFLVPRTVSTYRTSLNTAVLNSTTIPQNFMARRVIGAFRSQSVNYDQFYPSSSTVDAFIRPTTNMTSSTLSTQQVNILSANQNGTRLYGGDLTASMAWFGGYGIANRLTTFTGSMTTYINSI